MREHSYFDVVQKGFMASTYWLGVDWINVNWCFCRFLKRFKIRISYYTPFLRVLIISIGSILEVIFKMWSCRDIADSDETVHLYYGDTQCYGSG